MWRLRICFLFIVLLSFLPDGSAAPKKRRTVSVKPTLTWVKDNSILFAVKQAEELNTTIQSFKDSVKVLPDIYVVTQNDYTVKSPFFRAFKSTVANDKWYVSEGNDYGNSFVILVRPRSRVFTTPQLHILCNRNSPSISPFFSSVKINQLQNEYTKYLNDSPNAAYPEIFERLVNTLRSRFFDGQIRDYSHVISSEDEVEIARLIQKFQDDTTLKVAVVTTLNREGEDSVFGRALVQQRSDSESKKDQMTIEYKNLNADIVFVFYPKGVYVFSSLNNDKLSEKAIQNMISKFTLPQAKSTKYKQAMQLSLAALSAHLNDDEALDGMSSWEKLGAILLGVGIPVAFGWYIFKGSLKKKKSKPSTVKPIVGKPAVEKKAEVSRSNKPASRSVTVSKPEKKDEKSQVKPQVVPLTEVPLKVLPSLILTKPTDDGEDRGWTLDNTGSLAVTMNRIDEVFKPVSPRNGHEKAMLDMIDYMRSLKGYTDEEITHSLGAKGVSLYLDELYGWVDPAAVRIAFTRGLDLLLKNYSERDPRVGKYVK